MIEEIVGVCDFCKKENVEIWDINDFFLIVPKDEWQHNICDECLTVLEEGGEDTCEYYSFDDEY